MASGHKIVTSDKWMAARKKLLVKEKTFTRLADKLSKERRALPWEAVTKDYVFDGPGGKETLFRALRRPQPARRLPLHVRPGLGCGLPALSRWRTTSTASLRI